MTEKRKMARFKEDGFSTGNKLKKAITRRLLALGTALPFGCLISSPTHTVCVGSLHLYQYLI